MNYYILYLASGAAWFFIAVGNTFKLPPAVLLQRKFTPAWVVSLCFFLTFLFYLFFWPVSILMFLWMKTTSKSST